MTPHVCTTSLSHRCPRVPTAAVATSTKRTCVLLNTPRDGSRSMRVGTKQQGTTKAMEALFPVRALRAYNCQSSRLSRQKDESRQIGLSSAQPWDNCTIRSPSQTRYLCDKLRLQLRVLRRANLGAATRFRTRFSTENRS